jgi:hypothetical protein
VPHVVLCIASDRIHLQVPHDLVRTKFEDSPIQTLVRTMANDGWRLAYSYEACGNLNSYSPMRHYDLVRDRVFRVSYPGDSSSGYTILTKDNGDKTGSMIELMQEVADAGMFTWEIHTVSNASKSRYSSSYTACVHEVALNRTDLCVGNFWCVAWCDWLIVPAR